MRQASIWRNIKVARAEEPATDPNPAPAPATDPNPAPVQNPSPTPNYALLNNPEVASLVERARTEEKNKLHKDMDALREQVRRATEASNALSVQVGTLTADLGTANATISRLEAEASASSDERIVSLQQKVNELTGKLVLAETKANTLELESYKQQQIAKAEGKLITEMVTGSTMAEIEASVEKAKETYAKYNPAPATDPNPAPAPATDPNPAPVVGSSTPTTPQPSTQQKPTVDLHQMHPMKSRANREKYGETREGLGFAK